MITYLTINNRAPRDDDQTTIEKHELARRAVVAAYRLVARAQAAPSNEDDKKSDYGQLWKAYAKATATYPEM